MCHILSAFSLYPFHTRVKTEDCKRTSGTFIELLPSKSVDGLPTVFFPICFFFFALIIEGICSLFEVYKKNQIYFFALICNGFTKLYYYLPSFLVGTNYSKVLVKRLQRLSAMAKLSNKFF